VSRLYLVFTATAFQTRLAYRGEVWASLFGRLVEVLARIAIWSAVFTGKPSVDGISLSEMITYALIAGTVLGAWEPGYLINEVGKAVKTGDVAIHLLKPFHYPLYLFAIQLGNLGFSLIALVLPVIAVIGMIYGIQPPASVAQARLCRLTSPYAWPTRVPTIGFAPSTLCSTCPTARISAKAPAQCTRHRPISDSPSSRSSAISQSLKTLRAVLVTVPPVKSGALYSVVGKRSFFWRRPDCLSQIICSR